jgi:peptidyl-tRNA hydrolase, PTH1 family
MKLIVGLGNPGKKYALTRHNAGFMLVDKLRQEWNFPEFKFDKKFDAEISEGSSKFKVQSSKLLLVKSQTFMNNSGEAVKKIMDFYKLTPADLIIIHDDLDIELGKYKIAEDSRAAGHNGVQDIMDKIGTQEFKRVRIGIEGEEKRKSRIMPSEDFVLQNFTEEENNLVQNIFPEITSSLQNFL